MGDPIQAHEINWVLKKFENLTPYEVYELLRLRSEVFVVEQNCVFLDMDNLDQSCHHLLGYIGNELAVSTRILPAGLTYEQVSIGRVVGSPRFRAMGAGKALMNKAIQCAFEIYGEQDIKIGAQLYLKKFYEEFGFCPCSETYLEDNIPHIKMIRNA